MKSIYIIRHTTPDVEKSICYGQTNLEVNQDFEAEALSIKNILGDFVPDYVYSSPLKRCTLLAKQLFRNTKAEITPLLKEIDFGNWENTPWANLPKEELKVWGDDFLNEKPHGGENLNELNARAISFIEQYIEQLPSHSNTAIISHSGMIRCLVAHYLQIPLTKIFALKLHYGCIIKINIYDTFEEVEIIRS